MSTMAMDGEPCGFTWDDVDTLRSLADLLAMGPTSATEREDAEPLRSIADRIAALLPPRARHAGGEYPSPAPGGGERSGGGHPMSKPLTMLTLTLSAEEWASHRAALQAVSGEMGAHTQSRAYTAEELKAWRLLDAMAAHIDALLHAGANAAVMKEDAR